MNLFVRCCALLREGVDELGSVPWGARMLVVVGIVGLVLTAFGVKFEWPTFVFLVVAISPWLAAIVEKLKLGDFEVSLRARQERQQSEIDAAVRFLIKQHATDWEWRHLQSLAAEGPFHVELRTTFLEELRHLLTTGLIARRPGRGFRSLMQAPDPKDVKGHFEMTDAGRRFLGMRRVVEAEEERQQRTGAAQEELAPT